MCVTSNKFFDISIYRRSQKLVIRDGRSYPPHVPSICASKDDLFDCQELPHKLEGFLTIVSIKNQLLECISHIQWLPHEPEWLVTWLVSIPAHYAHQQAPGRDLAREQCCLFTKLNITCTIELQLTSNLRENFIRL